jgi:hypothetical protein
MNKKISIISILTVILLLALFLVGNGITGLVAFDPALKEICESNDDCIQPEVCCYFDEKQIGVCHTEEMCKAVADLTKKSNAQIAVTSEARLYDNYSMQILFGLLILASVALVIYHLFHSKPAPRKRRNSA